MTLAVERRDLLQQFDCLVCNELEAGIFFLLKIIVKKVQKIYVKSFIKKFLQELLNQWLLQWEAKEVFMPTI